MSDRGIREGIEQLSGKQLVDEVFLISCTVDSVDTSTRSCECTAVAGRAVTGLTNVQLMADIEDGVLIVPVIGSLVIVGYSRKNLPYVAMFSAVEKVLIQTASGVQLNDGTFGGLVTVEALTTKLNNLENDINNLKTAFNTWIVTPNDGGAALKGAAATWSGGSLTPTERTEIENTTVTHGS